MENETDLISRALGGDEDAYRGLLDVYKGRIFSFVYRIVRNYDDAEDITLGTFIRCFKALSSFDCNRSFSTWLFSIAHNLTVDFLRKRKQEYELLDERLPSRDDLVQEYERGEQLGSIEQALVKLAPIDREIVIFFYKEDKSYKEICEILNIPVTTIKTRLHRAREKLRDLVRKKE
ncbi:MAG: sigma-70 family RNA polymerase sigma factor [candidate division WOR-3 bacterium]|nr:sigma-70 family RNA polymerase sigma factor [candidate division WOR-3 bacterium]